MEDIKSISELLIKDIELQGLKKQTLDFLNREQGNGYFKPSTLGGCIRAVYYNFIGAVANTNMPSNTAEDIEIMKNGIDRHKRVQELLLNLDYFKWISVSDYLKDKKTSNIILQDNGLETLVFNDKLKIKFSTDGVLVNQNQNYIFELKTETTEKFVARKDIDTKHKLQITAYGLCLGINKCIVVYEDRQFLTKKSFIYNIDNDSATKLIKRIQYILQCVEKGQPPNKDMTNMTCTNCIYKNICKKEC